jgi:hypothetical protein
MKPQTLHGWVAAASLALLALPAWGEVHPQGHELRINSRTDFRQQNPVAAFAASGRALVVWENDQLGLRGQFLGTDGSPLGAELTLAASDALSGSQKQQITARREPWVAFRPDGGFVLAWTESREEVQSTAFLETRSVLDQAVFLQRFDATGNPAGARVRVSTAAPGFQRSPQLISQGEGKLLVTWESADGGIFTRALNAAGNFTGGTTRINDAAGSHPVGAANAQGAALVVWEASDGAGVGVFARVLSGAGQPVGPAFRVNTATAGRQRRPAVAAGTDGNFFVAWQGDLADPRQSSLFAQAVGAQGNLVGPQLTLAHGIGYDVAQIAPALAAAPGGHFLLSWLGWPAAGSTDFGMYAAAVDALGNTVGTAAWITERRVQQNFRRTSIAGSGTGSYLLTWETFANNRQSIDARRLGAN